MNELIFAFGLIWSSTLATASPAAAPTGSAEKPAPQIVSRDTAALKPAMPQPDAKRHAILFFTASWCPACLRMKAQTLPFVSLPGHELRVIDVDQNPQLGQSYGVQSLPAYVVLDGVGRAYKHGVGFRDVRQFIDFLNGR